MYTWRREQEWAGLKSAGVIGQSHLCVRVLVDVCITDDS